MNDPISTTFCSRRRKEADSIAVTENPLRYLGGYSWARLFLAVSNGELIRKLMTRGETIWHLYFCDMCIIKAVREKRSAKFKSE
jgi:hypothetical protein